MPIKVNPNENKEEFISRCMSAEKDSFPDDAQRFAVCISTYERKELSKQKFGDPQKRVQAKLNFERKYEGINLAPLEKGPNDPCYEDYVQIGTKILDGREVPNCIPLAKVEMELEKQCMCNLAEYDWDQCVLEQTDKYGSKDIAEKVCGAIKSKYGS
jgi:hypothetical protein